MINVDKLGPRLILGIQAGKFTIEISESTLWGLIVAVILAVLGIWLGSGLKKVPKGKQVFAEFIVGWIYSFTEKNLGKENRDHYAPFVGTIFLFVFFTSSFGLFGQRPITADINVTAALAAVSFLVIQVDGVRSHGFLARLKSFFQPYPFMLPIKIIENVTLPVTLALRLFGNIFGGMIVIELWMHLMEYLSHMISSVPFLRAVLVLPLNGFFDLFEPAIQTYIFTMLTMVNLKTAITAEAAQPKKGKQLKARKKSGRGRQAEKAAVDGAAVAAAQVE